MSDNIKRVLIVSGGTGGHIFPAAVFGKWLEDNQHCEVYYMCGSRELELEIYKSLNITPYKLSLSGSPLGSRSVFKILKRLGEMLKAFMQVLSFIKQIKPDRIFLFGGYISFMPLLIAKLKHIKLAVHEQNSIAGRVTRIAAKFGVKIAAGWQECLGVKQDKFVTSGIPVREPVRYSREDAILKLNIKPEFASKLLHAKIIGVAGGSLGSKALINKIYQAAGKLNNYYFLMLGDRPDGFTELDNIYFTGRQWDMNPFYSLCDALICRAGGSTLAEALRWEIPAVSVPWLASAENHQVKNAQCFRELGGGLVYLENLDANNSLADLIINLLNTPYKLAQPSRSPCESLYSLAES
ncbi:MAG: UDP-N-acetylglucosamine--N-acetylmuramyl-(pentapeptide) pyrophosphoryl-undecaprenol N-acetylglucosamine transferase [Synergistaceae bacterium]|nr:UDP-N-acetylglucosamine--N-acetylmuramyl-(pentapeptide) pyrophosphoryl-undecaprenol N-acetylglucosamine transferase [Synergistaceae bacterium]